MSNPNYKEAALGILASSAGVLIFWLWQRAMPLIMAGEFKDFFGFIAPILGLALASTLFGMAATWVTNPRFLYPILIAGLVLPLVFVEPKNMAVALAVLVAILASSAIFRTRKEYELSLGFSATKIFKTCLPLYFTIASLIIAAFYFSGLDEEKAISSILPRSTLNFFLNRLSGPLTSELGLPHLSPDATVDEVLVDVVAGQLQAQGIGTDRLSKAELARAITTERQELSRQYGITLKGGEKVSDVFYNTITLRLQDLLGPYREYLPYVSAVAFFFAFKALTIPLYYVSLLMGILLIKILRAGKILRSEKKTIEIERFSL